MPPYKQGPPRDSRGAKEGPAPRVSFVAEDVFNRFIAVAPVKIPSAPLQPTPEWGSMLELAAQAPGQKGAFVPDASEPRRVDTKALTTDAPLPARGTRQGIGLSHRGDLGLAPPVETLAERNKFATRAVGIRGRSRPTLQHASLEVGPLFRELRVRVSRVEVQAVAWVEEPVKGDRARRRVGIDEEGDSCRPVALAQDALPVGRERVEVIFPTVPAKQRDSTRNRVVKDVTGDALAGQVRSVWPARADSVLVRADPAIEPAVERDGSRLRRGEYIAHDALGLKTRQVEMQDDLVRGVVNPAEGSVLLEDSRTLDDLGIEFLA